MRHRAAFTLIEILVVIAIIALLAAILFPVFATAIKKGQQVRCATQLRQVGLAIRMYADDHDELPPQGGYDLPAQRMNWQDTLLQTAYLADARVLLCPSANPTGNGPSYRWSYGVNGWVMGWNHSVNMDTLPFPSRTVLATEKVGYDWPACPPGTPVNSPFYFPLRYDHPGGVNILCCDGHVAVVSLATIQADPNIIWKWN